MFNFIVYAHEEGVQTGPGVWLGPLLFLSIILLAILLGKLITKSKGNKLKEVRKDD